MKSKIWVVALALVACGTPKPGPKGPKAGSGAGTASGGQTRPAPKPAGKRLDISADLLATMAFSSFDTVLRRGLSYVTPHVPARLKRLVSFERIKAKLFRDVFRRQRGLGQVLDTTRPFALAVADPKVYRGKTLGPLIVALPVTDTAKLVDLMRRSVRDKVEKLPGGDLRFGEGRRVIFVRIVDKYAYAASHERLLYGAVGALTPALERAPKLGGRLVVELARIYGRYKGPIDQALMRVRRQLSRAPDPTGLLKYLRYVPDMQRMRAELDLRRRDIRAHWQIRSRAGSTFARYLKSLNAGAAWGTEYLPADAVMAVLTRFTPQRQAQRLDEMVRLASILLGRLPRGLPIRGLFESIVKRWHGALRALLAQTSGESAVAMHSAQSGSGVGFSAATRAKDAAKLLETTRRVLTVVAKDIQRIITLVARMSALPRIGLRVKLRKNAYRGPGGVKGDLVTFKVRYPRITKKLAGRFNMTRAQARRRLKKIRGALDKLFGKTATLALVTLDAKSGDKVALMAFGPDYKQRLSAMVAAARGGKPSKLSTLVQGYIGKAPLVALFYSPLALLVEQTMRVLDSLTTVPPQIANLVRQALPPGGNDVPVAFWMRTDQRREALRIEGSVSSDLVGLMVKGAMMFLTRGRMVPPPAPPAPGP